MNYQEQQPEKLENTNCFEDNAKHAVVFHDPITDKPIVFPGSASMNMSMEEYAKLRVPKDIPWNIITYKSSPNEVLPELNIANRSDKSLNMFYRYLNAL